MKSGEYYTLKTNEKIGIRLEAYTGNKEWTVQSVDIINGRPTRSFIFEKAQANKINKLYNFFNHSLEK
jgi:hypothetical protein